ncbi:MAG: LuxR C-terminal-related transcriptional regulator [Planctomycetota bacterium]|nr:LuxR C-terminal-related transcriptional regulator [Planctomycetota bacterium]
MAADSVHILAVACDRRAVEGINSAYRARGLELVLVKAQSLAAVHEYIGTSTPDVIIVDSNGGSVSASISQSRLPFTLPVIMFSQQRRFEAMAQAYQSGAVDFVVTEEMDELHWPATAAQAIERFQDRRSAVSMTDPNRRFNEIVDKLEDMVAVYSLDEQTQYINPGGRRALGVGPDVNVGSMDLSDVFPEWELATLRTESIPKAIDHGLWTGEMTLIRRPGRQFVAALVVLANRNGGNVNSISIIARDIAERRKYRQLARESAIAREKLLTITPRERQVFELVVAGKPNKTIARELFLSEKTIEKHRAKVKSKLNVASNADLVRLGVMAELP